MAEVFRPMYHVDPITGKRVNASCPGAVRKKSKTWHIHYYTPDGKRHKVKGYSDKKSSENKAAELERRGIRVDAGIFDATEAHAKTLLAEHVADYVRYKTAKEITAKQAALDGCRLVRVADIQPSVVVSFLA